MRNGARAAQPYAFPSFYSYPPYFTVQPIPETFAKQKALWHSLILDYCTHKALHILDVFDDSLELFRNKSIDRHLNVGEKRVFLDSLERDYGGRKGRWLEGTAEAKSTFLVLWRSVEESVLDWIEKHGEGHDVVLLDDLAEGLGLGAFKEAVVRPALEVLKREKKVAVFAHKSNGKRHIGIKVIL